MNINDYINKFKENRGRGMATAASLIPGVGLYANALGSEKGKGMRTFIGGGIGATIGTTAALGLTVKDLGSSELDKRMTKETSKITAKPGTTKNMIQKTKFKFPVRRRYMALPAIGAAIGSYIAHGKNK
jgi:hypothetical protein